MLRFKRILYSWPSIVILAALVIVVARAAFGVFQKEQESARSLTRSEAELKQARVRQEFLTAEIGRLQTLQGIENEIRDRFRVHKPDEKLIILVDGDNPKNATSTETEKSVKKNFWSDILEVFRGD